MGESVPTLSIAHIQIRREMSSAPEARQGDMRVKDEYGNEWIPGTQVRASLSFHFREQTARGDPPSA